MIAAKRDIALQNTTGARATRSRVAQINNDAAMMKNPASVKENTKFAGLGICTACPMIIGAKRKFSNAVPKMNFLNVPVALCVVQLLGKPADDFGKSAARVAAASSAAAAGSSEPLCRKPTAAAVDCGPRPVQLVGLQAGVPITHGYTDLVRGVFLNEVQSGHSHFGDIGPTAHTVTYRPRDQHAGVRIDEELGN